MVFDIRMSSIFVYLCFCIHSYVKNAIAFVKFFSSETVFKCRLLALGVILV